MALDRVVTLYESLDALVTRTGGVQVWAERTTRTALVALGDVGAYDTSGLVARESVTLRMRWRADVTLRSVFFDGDGAVWLIERLGEVGRHRWLEAAVSNFVSVDGEQILGVWPMRTAPYTAPRGWGLTDAAGAAVQNVTVRAWAPANNVDDPQPRFAFGPAADRTGYWTAAFNVLNERQFRGGIVSVSSATTLPTIALLERNAVAVADALGRRGWMHVWLLAASATYRVSAADAFIPLTALDTHGVPQVGALQVFFPGSTRPLVGIGQALRVLSTQELA